MIAFTVGEAYMGVTGFSFKPLNATGTNMHLILMLTENSGIERDKQHDQTHSGTPSHSPIYKPAMSNTVLIISLNISPG